MKIQCSVKLCNLPKQPVIEFAPAVSNLTHRKRAAFFAAVKAGDRSAIEKLRTRQCQRCRSRLQKTCIGTGSKKGRCRAKLYELRHGKACQLCGCDDALEFEHRDPSTKQRDKHGKTVDLSKYNWWASNRGPEGMEEEAKLCDILCCNCHAMQPTHTVFQRIDSATLPNAVSYRGDPVAYRKKHRLQTIEEKRAYVDGIKLNVGGCANCSLTVIADAAQWVPGDNGLPHCFEFAHKSELQKNEYICGLTVNEIKLSTVKPLIDAGVAKCRLLCACCHRVETIERNKAPGVDPR